MNYIAVDLFKDFECTADACPSTCCAGWGIIIDKETCKKMKENEETLGVPYEDWLIEGADGRTKAKLVNERCCMLNEQNLCNVVLKLGPEYLSKTCTVYPRMFRNYGPVQEAYLSVSCPEVIRSLMDKPYVDFDFGEDDTAGSSFQYMDLYFYESSVRSDLLEILQGYPQIGLITRVFACYQIIEKALELHDADCIDYEQLSPLISAYCREDILRSFESQLKGVIGEEQRFSFLQQLKLVLAGVKENSIFDAYREKFITYFENCNVDKYVEDLAAFREHMKEYAGFYNNYWAYRMFEDFLSFPDFHESKKKFLYIAAQFCLNQAMALAVYEANGRKLEKEEYMLIISHISRVMEHNSVFRKKLTDSMNQNNMISLAGVLLLTFV